MEAAVRRGRRWRGRKPAVEKLESRHLLSGLSFRSYDGQNNNLLQPDWGAAGTQLLRLSTVEYADGVSEPAGKADGSGRPNPREISNRVVAQDGSIPNDRQLTSFTFQWGQFLDHDLGLTEDARPAEPFMISVPADDPDLDPDFPIPMLRSRYDPATGSGTDNPRQQVNQITAYIDGSNVYGSDSLKARGLRAGYGGLLLTSDGTRNVGGEGHLLPWNYEFEGEYLENATPHPFTPDQLFIAGDIRSNEQPGLASLHTLFVLEHNYQARRITSAMWPGRPPERLRGMTDEMVYQMARMIVSAEIQSITYNEFLPALLGPNQLPSYGGYDPHVNAGIANIFSHALYRVGHTMLPPELLRLDAQGQPLPDGPVALGEAFFDPRLITDFGIEPYLKGLAVQNIQEIDAHIVDGVRNMLFAPPAQFDLAATNLQRGRDHGLPDYNQALRDFHLPPVSRFDQINSDPDVAAALEEAYAGDIENVDPWMGGIAADHVPGASVGTLVHTVLVDQFSRLRDGDRFYFENVLRGRMLQEIRNTRLSDIVQRNTSLQGLQDNVFRDISVLTYHAPEGTRPALLTVRVDDGQVQVVDQRRRVLAEKPLAETSRVVLFGTSKSDRVVLDPSLVHQLTVPLELHGGAGRDRLLVPATDPSDDPRLETTRLDLRHLQVDQGHFEYLELTDGTPRAAAGNGLQASAYPFHQLGLPASPADPLVTGARFGGTALSADGGAESLPVAASAPPAALTPDEVHAWATDSFFATGGSAADEWDADEWLGEPPFGEFWEGVSGDSGEFGDSDRAAG